MLLVGELRARQLLPCLLIRRRLVRIVRRRQLHGNLRGVGIVWHRVGGRRGRPGVVLLRLRLRLRLRLLLLLLERVRRRVLPALTRVRVGEEGGDRAEGVRKARVVEIDLVVPKGVGEGGGELAHAGGGGDDEEHGDGRQPRVHLQECHAVERVVAPHDRHEHVVVGEGDRVVEHVGDGGAVAAGGKHGVLDLKVVLLRALPLVRPPQALQAPHLQHLRLVALAPLELIHLVRREQRRVLRWSLGGLAAGLGGAGPSGGAFEPLLLREEQPLPVVGVHRRRPRGRDVRHLHVDDHHAREEVARGVPAQAGAGGGVDGGELRELLHGAAHAHA